MSKYKLWVAVLVVLTVLPSLALANWNASAMSSCSGCKALSCQMGHCTTAAPCSCAKIVEQKPVCPVCVPMEPLSYSGRAVLSPCAPDTTCAPANMKVYTMSVPVSIQTINNCPTMCTPMDQQLVNKVVLVPTSFGSDQMMLPAMMKPVSNNMMIFSPLDTRISGPAAVALQLNGSTCLAPLNWSSCVNNGSLCFPAGDTIPLMRSQTDIDKD